MKFSGIYFVTISIMIISCFEDRSPETIIKNNHYQNIVGHTFFKITEGENGAVLFKPCDANIEKFILFDDSIFHNWGQEYYTYLIQSISRTSNSAEYRTTYKYNLEVPETADSLLVFEPVGKDKIYWKINGEIFIDSLFINTIPYVNQLCSECYEDCEDVLSDDTGNNLEKWFGKYQVMLKKSTDFGCFSILNGKCFYERL